MKRCLWDEKAKAVDELMSLVSAFEQSQASIESKLQTGGSKPGGKGGSHFTPGNKENGWETGHSPPQNHSSNPRPNPPVKTDEPKRRYRCNSTDPLRNKCPVLGGSRQPIAPVNTAVLSTEASEAPDTSFWLCGIGAHKGCQNEWQGILRMGRYRCRDFCG